MSEQITVTLSLTDEEADALAMLAKRIGYSELASLSSCSKEAYAMVLAMAHVRRALSDIGFYLR